MMIFRFTLYNWHLREKIFGFLKGDGELFQ